jgi:putative ABC transport system permease protein
VAAVETFRAYEITYNGRRATFAGTDATAQGGRSNRAFLSGARPPDVFRRLRDTPDGVLVSEPFANKHGVRTGDVIKVALGAKEARFRVLDVYYDYSSERGYILVHRNTMLRYLPDPAVSSVAILLRAGVDLATARAEVESALIDHRVLVLTNRALREDAIRIFDRTFAITYALELVAVVVAVMGIAGALLALVIDRRREIGLLRVLGGARGQMRRLILFEAGLLGLLANVAGLALGLALSVLLIYVINKQSFGWTIQFHWPVGVLLGALTLVYAATVAAALLPARVAVRLNPIEVLHEE